MAVFTNQATLTYQGGSVRSNIVTGEIPETVSISKEAVSAFYTPGERVAYVISIVNTGGNALSGISVSDDLGAYETENGTVYPLQYADGTLRCYADGVLQPAPAVVAGPPLQISGIDIPAESGVMLVYEADVTGFAPLDEGRQITNTALVSGDCIPAPLSASAAISVDSRPQLSISKSMSPETVACNGELTYTFVIQNAGNTPALEDAGVLVSDTFNPALDGLAVRFNGQLWSDPADYSYTAAAGEFATAQGRITVPAASYARNADGSWTSTPGVSVLTVSGNVRSVSDNTAK